MAETISVERRGAATIIAIARPDRRNALNESVAEEIGAALDAAERDAACRAVVLTRRRRPRLLRRRRSAARAPTARPSTMNVSDPRHYVVRLLEKRMDACRLPVRGPRQRRHVRPRLRLRSRRGRRARDFGVSEVKVGLFPMMILPYLLPLPIPYKTMMELCLTGEPVKVEEARAIGLVNHVAPAGELDARTDWLLSRISESPTGIRLGKQALSKIREMSTESALEYAQFMLANMARTKDAIEGFAAFNEKRAPNWTGK